MKKAIIMSGAVYAFLIFGLFAAAMFATPPAAVEGPRYQVEVSE